MWFAPGVTVSSALKWIVGISTVVSGVLAYLLLTGEWGLARPASAARSVEITRLGAGEAESLGWSHGRLDAAFVYATTLSTDTLVIVTKGKTVGSFGDLSKPYRTHSIRKALLSALVGQHLGPGANQIRLDATLHDLGVDDAPGGLTDLQKQATVEHLLKSMSGINHPAAAEGGLFAEKDRRLGRAENKPGTIWAYNNWDYNALTTIFETHTGLKIAEAFRTGIALPTAMKDFRVGDVSYVSVPKLSRHKAAMFRMSARDLAKFGQLYLDEGRANGLQVLPASWIDLVTTDFTETGMDGLRWGHGYLWWIPDSTVGLPGGSFSAFGLGQQAILVIPAWETVIVHQSDTTEFLKRFFPMISKGNQSGGAALEQLILSCFEPSRRKSEYCVEHRLTTRREFAKLISMIVDSRL